MVKMKYREERFPLRSIILITMAAWLSLILWLHSAEANQEFFVHCSEIYQKTNICPEKICQLIVSKGEDAQEITSCVPRKCPDIEGKECPLEFCAIMTDCSDEEICHYQMAGESAKCGDLSYAGQNVECCDGFVRRCGIEFLDGSCDMEGKNSVYNIPICIPCGDGICSQFENLCNCPEDCDQGTYQGVKFEKEKETKKK